MKIFRSHPMSATPFPWAIPPVSLPTSYLIANLMSTISMAPPTDGAPLLPACRVTSTGYWRARNSVNLFGSFYYFAERVVVDEDDKLKVLVMGALSSSCSGERGHDRPCPCHGHGGRD
jgi:hypothetical protein